jgi:hypothetical protein
MSDLSDFFLQNLTLIEQTISSVCRRKGMNADEIEEFAAVVKLRLIEDDYAVIAAFQRRSSFGTYIAAVVARLFIVRTIRSKRRLRCSRQQTPG